MLAIINHGSSNLKSLYSRLDNLTSNIQIIDNPRDIKKFDRIILPGVGNYYSVANQMINVGWYDEIKEHATIRERPLLGICLGMQLLSDFSEEGRNNATIDAMPGLGLIKGCIKKLPEMNNVKIPHSGWNSVAHDGRSNLLKGIPSNVDFYFVHSYFFDCTEIEYAVGKTKHGIEFTSSVESDNIFGVQFHPEKSSHAGIKLLDNFLRFS